MQDQATACLGPRVLRRAEARAPVILQIRVGGKQVQKRLGPAWIVGGPPPDGYVHEEDRRGGTGRDPHRRSPWCSSRPRPAVGATVRDATEEWLRHGKCERGIKASTASEYRNVVEAHDRPPLRQLAGQKYETSLGHAVALCAPKAAYPECPSSSGKSKSAVRRRRPPHVGLFQPDPWRRDDEELRLHGIRGRGPPPEGHILARTNGG